MDAREIKELLRFVRDAGFSEFEMEQEGFRLRVVKDQPAKPNGAPAAVPGTGHAELGAPLAAALAAPTAAPALAPAAAPAAAGSAVAVAAPAPPPAEDLVEQRSPMVGTFYRASRPNAPPLVSVGDRVSPGQVLCIIEAMKLMNEIESEVAGTVVEVAPQNAQPVEYGEVLFRIRPN